MTGIKLNLNLGRNRDRGREKKKIIISASNLWGWEWWTSNTWESKYVRDGYSTRFDENVSVDNVEEALDVIFQFTSIPPSASIRINPSTTLYEVWANVTITSEGKWELGQNPSWTLTLLKVLKDWSDWFSRTNPSPWTWYWQNDNIDIVLNETTNYRVYVEDNQGRNNYSDYIRVYWTYPYYATTQDITVLTKQPLEPYNSIYFQANMVAETDTDKQKVDFEKNIAITWIQFYNTISWQWERLNWSKSASLNNWNITDITHDVQWKIVNYKRYTYTGVKVWARKLRFYTN